MGFRCLLLAAGLMLGLESPAAADSEPLVLTGSVQPQVTAEHLDYFVDADWSETPASALTATDRFRPLAGHEKSLRYTKARTWLRIRLQNATTDMQAWRLYVAENFKTDLKIYAARKGDDGALETLLDAGPDEPFSARPIDYPEIAVPISLPPGERMTLLISVWSEGQSSLDFALLTPRDFEALTVRDTAFNYLFYGMMVLIIAIGAVCAVVLRSALFAAYCGYAISALLYVMHVDGTSFQLLWPDFPRFNAAAASYLAAGIVGFGATFTRLFLRTATLHPRLDRAIIAIGLLPIVLIVALQPVDPQLLKRIMIVVVLAAITLYAASGFVAARTRFREVRFYLFAWISAVGSALVLNLDHTLGLEFSDAVIINSMRAVLVFDAVMMGLAIYDSYAQQREQRQDVMRRSLFNAQRNLQLNGRLGDLEARYARASQQSDATSERLQDTLQDLQQPLHALRRQVQQLARSDGATDAERATVEEAFADFERLVSATLDERDSASISDDARTGAPAGSS